MSSTLRLTRALLVMGACLLTILHALPARAHARSVSYTTFLLDPDGAGATVRLRVSWLDAGVLREAGYLGAGAPVVEHWAPRLVRLVSDRGPCAADRPPRESTVEEGWMDVDWHVHCPSPRLVSAASDLLFDPNPTHLSFLQIVGGDRPITRVLDASSREVLLSPLASDPAPSTGVLSFVRMGIGHIASGWDHLVFLAMLVLGSRSLRRTAAIVTGFSVGHAATLTLTVLGAVTPREAPVEALIGLSIALLAVENSWVARRRQDLWTPVLTVAAVIAVALLSARGAGTSSFGGALGLVRPETLTLAGVALFAACSFAWQRRASDPDRLRALSAALFGLVHGFGFARALTQIDLPRSDLAGSLFGFNLGVEIGQIAFVAALWPLVVLLRRRPDHALITRYACAAAVCAGTYWFVARSLA